MSIVIKKVLPAIEPAVTEIGYEIVDIEYEKKYDDMNLTIFIYSPNGVSLDDCEKVHNIVDPIIEELDPTNSKPFVLNVSSPGLDRPFKKFRDYERNYGTEVELKLYAPYRGKKLYEGVLIEKQEHAVVIESGKQEIKFEDSKVAFVRPLVKFE